MSERRSFKRLSGFRDARLLIIATEGESTEKAYFEGLKQIFHSPRTHIEVLKRTDSASDPVRIMRMIDQFRSTYKVRQNYDQLWVVIDVDKWGDQKLALVSQQCAQKKYHLAVSNPAFEIWLLLHVRGLETYSDEEKEEFILNKKVNNRSRLEQELCNLLGHYNKSNLDMSCFSDRITTAIANSRACDIRPDDRWPNELGTRVYILAELIIT